ncbi:LPXTG cell wall anchor domain-containing protein [Nocardioides carbamazepini]|uniref:LPXTG cell wall anchor domain-containing protein n=1 Tax=Nocardioides carbamazepini TaxID=2854259 RepID=UPI002149FC5E|nr:LPXTG cell wall anchor domain-containing protein [Nocardioides carbamazepini]MCR1782772.1 LPXTG cell wall anchor domain-containing protein [Nocardioides carbamazepini]
MLKKLAALAMLTAAFAVAPSTPAQADGYTPKIPTVTTIKVIANEAGKPVVLEVSASANHPTPPAGNIAITLATGGTAARGARALVAAPVFTTTVHFVDQAIRVEGPRLPKGKYVATAALTPDNAALFLPSSGTTQTFRVDSDDDNGSGGGGDQGAGLPNTGGPDLMWLLLGGGLVVAGAGGVSYGRRRIAAVA